jgi:hypothetical protein
MSLRYQKRINLGKGVGLNVSQAGVSGSLRTKSGSIGTRGFSIKTGIPGLNYRGSWARGSTGAIIFLVFIGVTGVGLIVYNVVRLIIYLIAALYEYLRNLLARQQA